MLHNGRYPLVRTYNGSTYTIAFKQAFHTGPNTIISEEMIRNREVGSKVLVSPPAGSFSLDNNAKNHLRISGAFAITSFMMILQDLKIDRTRSNLEKSSGWQAAFKHTCVLIQLGSVSHYVRKRSHQI